MKPELKYGLICGVAVCAWIGVSYALGFHTTRPEIGAHTGYLSNLIPLVTLFLLLRARRARVYDGHLSLGAGIGAGVYASFVAALIVYCGLVAYSQFINPAWIYQVLEVKVAAWRAQQVAETDIQERIKLYVESYTPENLAYSIIVGMTLMGGLFSFVLTLLVRQLPHRPA